MSTKALHQPLQLTLSAGSACGTGAVPPKASGAGCPDGGQSGQCTAEP